MIMIPAKIVRVLAAVLCFAVVAGCRTSTEDARIPVEGKVTLGGKSLTTGTVILRPDVAKGNDSKHEPRGRIDATGAYRVETALQPGAPPGWYKVAVLAFEPTDPKAYAPPVSLIPEKYNDPEQSGFSFEVTRTAQPGAFDLKLEPKIGEMP
jgi:hypothetical protein